MALKIRLQRGGSNHNPEYRIVVAESSARRDGRFVEALGTYSPKARGSELEHRIKMDRVEYWVSVGAKPSETVRNLMRAVKRGETGQSKRPSASNKAARQPVAVA